MRTISIASALLLSLVAFAPAQAAAVAPVSSISAEQPIVLAQYHSDGRHHSSSRHHSTSRHTTTRRHYSGHTRYRPGYRYSTAPHGWHRYHSRPSNWNRRGCVMVGPLWFCP